MRIFRAPENLPKFLRTPFHNGVEKRIQQRKAEKINISFLIHKIYQVKRFYMLLLCHVGHWKETKLFAFSVAD